MSMKPIKEKKIAVIGVSHKEEKYGFKIFRDLLKQGFQVEGVNPTNGEVLGKKIRRSLKEITPAPDLVITVVPSKITERVVEECRDMGIKEIWMQPGSESDEAIRNAKAHGISVTHNACFMIKEGGW